MSIGETLNKLAWCLVDRLECLAQICKSDHGIFEIPTLYV